MGGALGGAVGLLAQKIVSFPMASSGAYAVVGMGAVVAASTHAPITSILIIFELTGDYGVIPGLMIASILAVKLSQRLGRDSIYTIKLARRGIDLQTEPEVNVLRKIKVSDIMRKSVETVSRGESLTRLHYRMMHSNIYEFFVIDDEGGLHGIISFDNMREAMAELASLGQLAIAEDLMSPVDIFLREDDDLDCAMRQFGKRTLEELPVLPKGQAMKPVGTIGRQDVIEAYNKAIVDVDMGGAISSRIDTVSNLKTWETVGDYVLAQVEVPSHFCGKPLESLRLRQEKRVQIILIERRGAAMRYALPARDSVLQLSDKIIIFGRREDVGEFN
jgi:CIC family chloride channel protein